MLAIDLSSHGAEISLKVLIFLDIFAAGNGNLNKNNLVLQLRMIVQEGIETTQLLRETFDMVESVDSYYDLGAFITFFEGSDAILDFGRLQRVREFLWVDAHDEFIGADETVLVLDLIWNLGTCIAVSK